MPEATTFRSQLLNTCWALRAASIAERNELIAYARRKGVKMWGNIGQDDYALDLGMTGQGKLIDYDGVMPTGGWTTAAEFKQMCDAYAARP